MSFFIDVLNELGVSDWQESLSINIIKNKGAAVAGKFKILSLSEDAIFLKNEKEIIEISGENLFIKTMSKGELLISGKIKFVKFGE